MLYRRNNSRHWWCRFTPPGGKEVRRSTGTPDRKDAEEYEAALKRELWRQAKMGERPRKSWQDAVVRWIEETEHKASHADDLIHLRWLDPHLGSAWLDEIDVDRVDAIKRARKGEGVSNATVNRTLSVLRAILRRAERQWRWIDRAAAVSLLPEPKQRIRWLTREEADRLIAELPEHLADMAQFTLATGLRASNVTGLEWSQIDMQRQVAWVHADQSKSRRALGVPLNASAIEVIRRWVGRHPTRVFCYRRRGRGEGERWVPIAEANSAAWYKALKRAGIEDFRWHDLRHTWASWHVQAGTPLHALQEMGGWQSYDMVRRYAHLAPEHLAEHAARLEGKTAQNPAHLRVIGGGKSA